MKRKEDYAYTPDDVPSHWKLDISDREHCIAAKAALGPKGFRGQRVQIPEDALPGVIRKLNAACKKFGLKPFGSDDAISQADIQNGKDALAHFGVLGMKWGVRKARTSSGSSSKTKSDTDESAPKKKTVKEMSDTELRQKINRLQMERQYSELTSTQKKQGQSFVKQFMKQSASTLGSAAVQVVAEQVVKQFVSEQIGKRTRFQSVQKKKD